ncbi:nickel/cobalt transporter [Pelagibius litoralis]|uniref:Nickel/cobalt efflux system n=1 Tax=Pelagibius litoralis TaxID=374515 RepID=A0A967KI02_9PROT|nr:nickel/cobalt transporter [Pelagibius litoralis]NIA71791.1 nickel/cobalt transporter [Pelagibius litoralis]
MTPAFRWIPRQAGLCAVLLLVFCVLWGGPQAAAQTPLVPPPEAAAGQPASAGPWQTLLLYVHQMQGDLHRRLAGAVRALKGDAAGEAALFLVALSFLYGVFHAVGPGHGKAVISTYLLANESVVRRGIVLAFLASFLQGLTAVVLVGLLAVLLDMSGLRVTASVGLLESASYALVALVGLWLLWSLLRSWRGAKGTGEETEGHDHGHDPAQCGHNHAPDPALLSRRGFLSAGWGVVAAVGLRPCSGAVLVLLFALAQGVLLAGIAATAAMSLGTAMTVSALALLTLWSKRLAVTVMGGRVRWVETFYQLLGFGGAVLLILLGSGLFIVSLRATGPL